MQTVETLSFIGQHVRLEPMQRHHAPDLLRAATVSRATYGFTLVPDTPSAMEAYVERALHLRAKREAVPFVAIDQGSDAVVGATRFMSLEYWTWPSLPLQDLSLQKQDGSPDVAEIGSTWISEPFQRTAINTEAKLLMLTFAFETWHVQRLTFKTDARNQRSRSNIERVGAKFEGVLRSHMPAYDGGVRDTAFFSILPSEWPITKAALRNKLR